jgi:hypothetical protein
MIPARYHSKWAAFGRGEAQGVSCACASPFLHLPLPVLWTTGCGAGDDGGPGDQIAGLELSMLRPSGYVRLRRSSRGGETEVDFGEA